MSDPLFKDADEQERLVAPHQVPGEGQLRAQLEGETDYVDTAEPAAAPVHAGSSPNSMASPPNIGDEPTLGAEGDPQTRAKLDD